MPPNSHTHPHPPEPPVLPDARHIERVPPGIGKAGIARLRQATHALPQVVPPADYGPDADATALQAALAHRRRTRMRRN